MTHRWAALNRTLARYGNGAEQEAYEAMQQSGFRVADVLMTMAPGTMTTPIAGTVHFIGELNGQTEIFCASDYSEEEIARPEGNYSLFMVSQFEGLSAQDLWDIKGQLDEWLRDPAFLQRDGGQLQQLVDLTYGRRVDA